MIQKLSAEHVGPLGLAESWHLMADCPGSIPIIVSVTSRRLLFLLGIAAALLFGTALRLSTRRELASGARVRALTSDDFYHLRRARFAVAHFPATIFFDPLMNFPDGGVPIWPPLFDLALATPARLFHGSAATPEQLEREAAWVPVILAAGAILLAGGIGGFWGPAGAAALALFVALSPGHIHWTQYGHTDQHVLESFAGLAVLLLFLRSREEPPGEAAPRRKAWREAATGLALAAAVFSWQGAIYWGAIIALSLFLHALRTRDDVLWPTLLILGLSAALTALGTAAWLGPSRPPFTYVSFGFFQPLFLAALAGGTLLLETGLRASRHQLSRRAIALRAGLLAAAAIAVVPFAGGLLLGFARGAGYVLRETDEVAGAGGYVSYPKDWLKGIFEARPLLADGPGVALRQLSAAFFLAPLVVLLWAARAIRGARPGIHISLAVWGAVTLLLALSQRLNVYYAAPLAGLALIEAARLFGERLGIRSERSRTRATVLAGLLLFLPMAWGLSDELAGTQAPGSDLFATLDWMRRELPHAVEPYDPRLLGQPPYPAELDRADSVLAPWSLGHMILYNAELPVVANNFGYGFLDSIRFFLAESEEEALALARRRRARWVLATDLAQRMNDYAGYLGRPAYLRVAPGGIAPTPRYFSTLQSRLYDFDGAGARLPGITVEPLGHFRMRFHSRSAIRRGGRWLARWKVFEIVK